MANIQNKNHNSQQKIWKTALYVRLSKEDGNDVSYSITHQKQRLLDYVTGSKEQFKIINCFIDDGKTGTDSHRTAFQSMLREVKMGHVNCIIVKDLSRLSRNYIEAGHYMEQFFVDQNVRFISLELPALDSVLFPEQMNTIIVPIQNVINDDFCRQTSIKIRGVFQMKRNKGEFIGAFAPYGYIKNPNNKHQLIVDEQAAKVVHDIYYWYVYQGMSKHAIAKQLNYLGIPNPTQYKHNKGFKYSSPHVDQNDGLWNPSTIAHMLKNQVYIGHMVQGRHRVKSYKVHKQIAVPREEWIIVEHTHDPIIEPQVFEAAQALQKMNIRIAPTKSNHYIFSGFLRCADCDKAMTRRTAKKLVYYACRTYKDKSEHACAKHSIREDHLKEVLLQTLQLQFLLIENRKEIAQYIEQQPVVQQHIAYLNDLQLQAEQTLAHLYNKVDGLYLDWKIGEVSHEMYKRIQDRLEQKIADEKNAIEHIKKELEVQNQKQTYENAYLQTFLNEQKLYDMKRSTMIDFIDKIYIKNNQEIEIDFTFKNPFIHMSI